MDMQVDKPGATINPRASILQFRTRSSNFGFGVDDFSISGCKDQPISSADSQGRSPPVTNDGSRFMPGERTLCVLVADPSPMNFSLTLPRNSRLFT